MENRTLMTDLYELTMNQTYFNNGGRNKKACFDIFFRKNSFKGGYTISAGLDNIIDYIKNIKITEEDIAYLRSLNKFSEEFLTYLKDFKFNGNIYAVPDGTPVFPNEPVMTVVGNVMEAQFIETALLACFNSASIVATAAKRITDVDPTIPVMEFGARRVHGGLYAAPEASKYAYIGGCVGTSNVLAGRYYGIPVMGTMAHSLVTESSSEYEAFMKYAESNPENCVFLVDTYNTLKSGIPNAIRVAKEYLIPNGYKLKGIRIDSGNLVELTKEARKMLDEAGFKDTTICVSNGLDEYSISKLLKSGAYINSIGAGDNIAAPKERVGGVYKLVAIEENNQFTAKIKVSDDAIKTTNPGYKKVYRVYDRETGYALGDVIALYDEKLVENKYRTLDEKNTTNYFVKELQEPIFINGKLVYQEPSIKEKREYCIKQMATLRPEVRQLENPHQYRVDLSIALLKLKNKLLRQYSEQLIKVPVKKIGSL